MSTSSVGDIDFDLESLREELQESHLDAVRDILTDDMILDVCRTQGYEFRERMLAPIPDKPEPIRYVSRRTSPSRRPRCARHGSPDGRERRSTQCAPRE